MSALDNATARIIELDAQVERLEKEKQAVIAQLAEAKCVIKELTEHKEALEVQNLKLIEDRDCVKADKEVEAKDFKEKICYLQKHADELQSKLTMSVSEIEHFKKMYEDAKKSFDVLCEGSKAIDQSLKDEKTKNEELTTIIDSLSRTVHNLSSCLK